MHSSQYLVEQHGVLTASRKSLEHKGHASVGSEGASWKTSARDKSFDFVRLRFQDALCSRAGESEAERLLQTRPKLNEGAKNSRIRLSYDIRTIRCDHDTCLSLLVGRLLDSLEETSRNTGRALEPRLVVKVSVIVGGALLNPVT